MAVFSLVRGLPQVVVSCLWEGVEDGSTIFLPRQTLPHVLFVMSRMVHLVTAPAQGDMASQWREERDPLVRYFPPLPQPHSRGVKALLWQVAVLGPAL